MQATYPSQMDETDWKIDTMYLNSGLSELPFHGYGNFGIRQGLSPYHNTSSVYFMISLSSTLLQYSYILFLSQLSIPSASLRRLSGVSLKRIFCAEQDNRSRITWSSRTNHRFQSLGHAPRLCYTCFSGPHGWYWSLRPHQHPDSSPCAKFQQRRNGSLPLWSGCSSRYTTALTTSDPPDTGYLMPESSLYRERTFVSSDTNVTDFAQECEYTKSFEFQHKLFLNRDYIISRHVKIFWINSWEGHTWRPSRAPKSSSNLHRS